MHEIDWISLLVKEMSDLKSIASHENMHRSTWLFLVFVSLSCSEGNIGEKLSLFVSMALNVLC